MAFSESNDDCSIVIHREECLHGSAVSYLRFAHDTAFSEGTRHKKSLEISNTLFFLSRRC